MSHHEEKKTATAAAITASTSAYLYKSMNSHMEFVAMRDDFTVLFTQLIEMAYSFRGFEWWVGTPNKMFAILCFHSKFSRSITYNLPHTFIRAFILARNWMFRIIKWYDFSAKMKHKHNKSIDPKMHCLRAEWSFWAFSIGYTQPMFVNMFIDMGINNKFYLKVFVVCPQMVQHIVHKTILLSTRTTHTTMPSNV